MVFLVSNRVAPLVPAIVKTSDPANVAQYDLFNLVKPMGIVRGILQEYPSIYDPFSMVPQGFLKRFGYYIGIFSAVSLEYLHDSGIAHSVWESGFKRLLAANFPYVTDENGVFSVNQSAWKGPMYFTSTLWVKKLLGADVANTLGYDGSGQHAVVIDTGGRIAQQTPHLQKRTAIPGNYVDAIGHGEWCASALGGQQAQDQAFSEINKKPVACEGMAPGVSLTEIKALDYVMGTGADTQLLSALHMAADLGADVVSCSWGGTSSYQNPTDSPYYDPIKQMSDAGQVVLFASGDSGPSPATCADPGDMPDALTVGSVNAVGNENASFGPAGAVSGFSGRVPSIWGSIKPDVTNSGSIIDSQIPGWMLGSYTGVVHPFQAIAGTSMSTPIQAGINALWRQAYKKALDKTLMTPEIKTMMAKGSDRWNISAQSNDVGWGLGDWHVFREYMADTYGVAIGSE